MVLLLYVLRKTAALRILDQSGSNRHISDFFILPRALLTPRA